MAIRYVNNRQYPKYALAHVNAELSLGAQIILPPGAIIMGGMYTVVEPVESGTATITLTDNGQTPHNYLSGVSMASVATGNLAANSAGKYYPAGGVLTFTIGGSNGVGGKALVSIGYLIEEAQNELYGRSDGAGT